MSEDSVAYQALNLARASDAKINAHEELCAERYGNIHKAIDDIKGVLWKAGAAAFSIIMSMLAFLVVQQLNTNAAQHDENQVLVRQLQQQLSDERAARAAGSKP